MRTSTILAIIAGIVYIFDHTLMTWHYSQSIPKAWEIYLRGAVAGIWLGVFCVKVLQWWVDRVERSEEE